MFEVWDRHIDNVIQPPSRIQVLYDPVVLLAERLVDAQRFLCIRLGHLEVMF